MVDRFGRRAVEVLQVAKKEGYFNDVSRVEHLKRDKVLDAIRHRVDYQLLIEQIENKSP